MFASQDPVHFPADVAVKALVEMRRVLKRGGVLATRDAVEQHFYPKRLGLDNWQLGEGRWSADG